VETGKPIQLQNMFVAKRNRTDHASLRELVDDIGKCGSSKFQFPQLAFDLHLPKGDHAHGKRRTVFLQSGDQWFEISFTRQPPEQNVGIQKELIQAAFVPVQNPSSKGTSKSSDTVRIQPFAHPGCGREASRSTTRIARVPGARTKSDGKCSPPLSSAISSKD